MSVETITGREWGKVSGDASLKKRHYWLVNDSC
jgi:hypothetical protein